MLSFALTAMLAATFSFEGGSQIDLVAAVSKYTMKPVILNVHESDTAKLSVAWPTDSKGKDLPFDSGRSQWIQSLAKEIKVIAKDGKVVAFRQVVLPWYRFPNLKAGRSTVVEFPENMRILNVSDGDVRIKPIEGKYYWTTYLPFAKFSKHTACHKFLQTSPVAMSAMAIPERDFLESLASAIGGKLVESDERFFIDVDLDVIRAQYVAHFEEIAANTKSALEESKAMYQAEAIKQAPEKLMRRLVDEENSLFQYDIAVTSRAHQLGMNYARLFLAELEKPFSTELNFPKHLAVMIRDSGNFARPFVASISSLGTVDLGIRVGDKKLRIDF